MNNKSKYKKPTREDYISFLNQQINDKNDYVHFGITGIFDRDGWENNKTMYENKWWFCQKNIKTFFRIIARLVCDNRDWGKIKRDREMRVIIIPEVQSVLHFHGIMSIHSDFINEVNYDTLRIWLKQLWDKYFPKGNFEIDLFENDGWFHYITKKPDLGVDIIDEFVILPPIAHK